MKKLINNNKYTLLIIAISIYGFLFYEVKDNLSSENNITFINTIKQETVTPNIEHELDPINYNYRNPFRKGNQKNTINKKKNSNNNFYKKKKYIKLINPEKIWLPVSLKAIISNENKNICIVYIDSKEYLFNEMDSTNGYQVTKINTNSITITHNNEYKLITL